MNATRLILPLALLAALAAACATLRVDVDVYTGPLADHEDIQAERMAVMAIGAKPLLIELRDRLENREREKRWNALEWPKQQGKIREIGPGWDRYEAGHMVLSDAAADYDAWDTLIDTKARRVNAVLGLYEDMLNKDLAPYLRKGLQSYEDYKSSQAILESPEAKEWQDRMQARAADPSTGEIARAYVSLFDKKIFVYDVINCANAAYKRNYPELADNQDAHIEDQSTLYFTDLVQDRFGILSTHAERLYPEAGERARFVRAVRERAQAFLDKRTALEQLYAKGLHFIREINTEPLRSRVPDVNELTDLAAWIVTSILRAGDLAKIYEACKAGTDWNCKKFVLFRNSPE